MMLASQRSARVDTPDRSDLSFPVVYHAASSRPALAPWIGAHQQALRATVAQAGAVLLRGFAIPDPQAFARAASAWGGPLSQRYEGPSPRVGVAPGVYTASEVWSALSVPEHAEMSYLPRMPRFLYFWCRRPAQRGGATTLVDGRRVLARLDQRLIAPLLAGPLHVRCRHARPEGWHDPFELKRWPAAFGTHDPQALAARARALGWTLTFERDGAITLEQTHAAVRAHPESGERVWLNHLLVFHGSAPSAVFESALRHDRELRAALAYPAALVYRALTRAGYRAATEVSLASGAPVPDALVAHVREVMDREAVHVDWREGDLLIIDNHLALHGRRPFRGRREVIAAWSEARA